MIARAPGKILLAGEYAVLDGAPAVVLAVDRHVIARRAPAPARLSPFLEAARLEIAAHSGKASPEAAAAARITVDSSALASGGTKLGLGSSAAATVAAIACALGTGDRELIHRLAHRAHARAQEPRGARGSGADIAACVHGGVLEVRRAGDPLTPLAVRPLELPPVELVLVWTGQPAHTPALVAAVCALRTRDRSAHQAALDEIAAAAADLAAARDARAAIQAIRRGARALALLGERAAVPLTPQGFAAVESLVASHGGAAKPTGAGGGDLICALFPDRAAAGSFQDSASKAGMTLIAPRVSPDGVQNS